jgi:pyruvate dehydrogenase E1 component alpha subunit
MSDAQQYRTKEEVEEYRKIDPITQIEKIIAECEEFSESSPFPDTSVMYDVVYEQNDYPFIKHKLD